MNATFFQRSFGRNQGIVVNTETNFATEKT